MRLARRIGFIHVALLTACVTVPPEPDIASRPPELPAQEVSPADNERVDAREEPAALQHDTEALERESVVVVAEVEARRDERERVLAQLDEVEGDPAAAQQRAAAIEARGAQAKSELQKVEASIERRSVELARLDQELTQRPPDGGSYRGESSSVHDARVAADRISFLPGLHSVPDPSEERSSFLKTDNDRYLGRIQFEEDIEVVPGEFVQGQVIFFPLRHRDLQ